jgi:predicted nucleic acid-binding protein
VSNSGYKINEWYVKIPKNSSVPIPWIEEANILSIQRKVENNIFSLEKKLARPYINESLPDASRKEDVLGWLQLSKEIHYMRSSEYIGYNDEEQEKYLKIIINDSKY